jgi:hypothetical protein
VRGSGYDSNEQHVDLRCESPDAGPRVGIHPDQRQREPAPWTGEVGALQEPSAASPPRRAGDEGSQPACEGGRVQQASHQRRRTEGSKENHSPQQARRHEGSRVGPSPSGGGGGGCEAPGCPSFEREEMELGVMHNLCVRPS